MVYKYTHCILNKQICATSSNCNGCVAQYLFRQFRSVSFPLLSNSWLMFIGMGISGIQIYSVLLFSKARKTVVLTFLLLSWLHNANVRRELVNIHYIITWMGAPKVGSQAVMRWRFGHLFSCSTVLTLFVDTFPA